MRFWAYILPIMLFCAPIWAQKEALAENYFEQGAYDKALSLYQRLVEEQPRQPKYVLGLVNTYQELSQFDEAENLLKSRLREPRIYPLYYIALANNFNRQRQIDSAQFYIDKALDYTFEQPNYTVSMGKALTDLSLLGAAKILYQGVMQRYPEKDFNLQLARVYGELGALEPMFETYLTLMESTPRFIPSIQRYLETYITEDPLNPGNIELKTALIKRLSQGQEPLYNSLLSWLFAQQKEYGKAFIQEKAIFMRSPGDLTGIKQLGYAALNDQQPIMAKTIFSFVLETAVDPRERLAAHLEILRLDRSMKQRPAQEIELRYTELIQQYRAFDLTQLNLDYAHFLAFDLDQSQKAIDLLDRAAERAEKSYAEGRLRLLLGDILVFNGQYNQALVNYALVQSVLKDDDLAQEAKFKEAQTSYFRGDFEWAQTQLKVLKSSTAQKMSNDAIALHVLINENTLEDSTQIALKKFAGAQLLMHQKKYSSAIEALNTLQLQEPMDRLADDILHNLGSLYRLTQAPELAKVQWETLIREYPDSVYIDDALFALSELMLLEFKAPEQAQNYLEEIIFNHADSIYFIDAQKQYRKLRGDQIN
ncbi:MAG: tetratricopeptide repeat protein [Flavobacteriaceae bacterium]|nr:tetratricopeptide repeat protein [Flavobacteriaceae bacterium]